MKILMYCPVFYPMVGGMETVTECMADLFIKKGHECKLITPIITHERDKYSFEVYRKPDFITKIKLILWADIVVSKGASLKLLPLVKILFKPYVWIHSGYQASCIDGLGWVDGNAAPLTPLASIKFHYRRKGFLFAFIGALKLFLRRFASKYMVAMNVAVSDWVAMRQPFKKQIRIHNPFPIYRFMNYSYTGPVCYDFVYLGRLVSEKGLPTLIHAFYLLLKKTSHKDLKLLIIGDGDWKERLEKMVEELGIQNNIDFVGRKSGAELTELIYQSNIAVVPSEWEEPMGGVALELLAAGRSIIISKDGGLAECVGDAGLTFANSNHIDLSERMLKLLEDENLVRDKKEIAKEQLKKFNPEILIEEYISLFRKILPDDKS